jgi:hypothetical protein
MTFLNPAWLLLALAAAVPIVLHLMRRRIATRVDLPTARYLARAEAEHSRELRLRNILLMLVRAGIILFVALAAARPFVTVPGGARAPGSLALVIDNTLSSAAVSGGQSALDRLRAGARTPLQRLGADDRAWIVTADASIHAGPRDELLARLDSLRAFPGRGDLPRALMLAAAAVQGSGLPGEIGLLTDAQSTQWRDTVHLAAARLVILALDDDPPPNRSVIEALPEPLRWTGGSGALNIAFLTADSALYRITVGGQSVLRGLAEPDGRVRAPLTTSLRGWFAGTAEVERDELPLDDVRHFAVFAGPPPNVAIRPGAGDFAATAVATLASRGRVREGPGIELASADFATRLPALITAPADPVRLVAANRALERLLIPWRFAELQTDTATALSATALFGDLQPPRVFRRYRLTRAITDTSVRFDTIAAVRGEPWIIAGQSFVLLASALDPEHTTLPVSAAFVPWLERMLAHRLTPDALGVLFAHPGDTVSLPSWADGIDGASDPLRRHIVAQVPAVHFLNRGDTPVGAVIVNTDRRESNLERLPPDFLQQRFTAASVAATTDPRAFDRALLSTRGRRDVTTFALALALALVAVESLLRRQRPPTRRLSSR